MKFMLIHIVMILAMSSSAFGSGVENIIENERRSGISGSVVPDWIHSEAPQVPDAGQPYGGYSGVSNDIGDTFLSFNLSLDNMRAEVANNMGVPEGLPIVLILFTFAALLQMGRVISGAGAWTPFIVRVVVIIFFLKSYGYLFDVVSHFVAYLSESITGSKNIFDLMWNTSSKIWNSLSLSWSYKSAVQTLFYVFSMLSYILALVAYVLLHLVQSLILIALEYLGPIIIALAIIPEIDFSTSYITSLVRVYSWTILLSVATTMLSVVARVNVAANFGIQDHLWLIVMNVVVALMCLQIPKIADVVFASSAWGGVPRFLGGVSQAVSQWGFHRPYSYLGGKILGPVRNGYYQTKRYLERGIIYRSRQVKGGA